MKQTEENTRMDDLISEYLSHRLNNEEQRELEGWIDASAENERYFHERREIWLATISAKDASSFDSEKGFQRFLTRVREENQSKGRKVILKKYAYTAAVVALLLLVTYSAYWQGGNVMRNRFQDMVVEVPMGSNSILRLPDGTRVHLNAGSKIIYSQGFGVDNRNLQLSGERYFEVTKNKELPFRIQTRELAVEVLGTTFNLRNYDDDAEAVVSLLEGKVSMINHLNREETLPLLPDEKIVLNKSNGKTQLVRGKTGYATEWTKGYLFFDEKLLPDIAKELERAYNVNIQIADDTLKNYRFYGNFVRKEQTIEEILNILASTDKIAYSKRERNIVITLK